jgi:hypothetical protein
LAINDRLEEKNKKLVDQGPADYELSARALPSADSLNSGLAFLRFVIL